MKRKIVFLSYPLLSNIVQNVVDEIDSPYPIEIKEVEIGEPKIIAQRLDIDKNIAAIVTVRGHAIFIPKLNNTPLIVNKVSGDDFLHALQKASALSNRLVMMRFGGVFDEFVPYDNLINLEIYHDTYQSVSEAKKKMKEWISKGITTFVGTSVVINEAEKLGANSVYVYSKKSIKESIEQAINLVKSMEAEKAKYERINTIIHNSSNAVLATDAAGNIEYINNPAVMLFKQSENELIGKCVKEVLPGFPYEKLIDEKKVIENFILNINSIHIVASITPIVVENNTLGFVVTFQEVSKVHDADTKIRKELAKKGLFAKYNFSNIIFKSDVMKNAIDRAKVYAETDATILIQGETGTGKELFAQSIHNYSKRSKQSFVAVNCSALPENLLESELFGYEEGAFTGAKKGGKTGLFEMAHKGTIFLDEIGEITPKLQSRLLRVLQEKEIMRVGGDYVIPVNVRIIAATNKELRTLVEKGEFREDLYYRLNTLFLNLPSLRMRRQDLPLLITHFLEFKGLKKRDIDIIIERIINSLSDYPWKGNIRELENVVERIYVIYKHTKNLDFIQEVLDELVIQNLLGEENDSKLEEMVKQSEIGYINRVLDEVGGNRNLASKKLGISRTTLWRKLNQETTDVK